VNRIHVCIMLLVGLNVFVIEQGQAESTKTLIEWTFDKSSEWNGWWPNGLIRNVSFEANHVVFEAAGSDPQINSPPFELPGVNNRQWIEIDLDCSAAGLGELFYTNTTKGQYSGLRPTWMTRLFVPSAGKQTVQVWPFWESLGKIIRLRFDPPSNAKYTLRAIRIVEMEQVPTAPEWPDGESFDSWQAMYAARNKRTSHGLEVQAAQPQAMIITAVKPFDSSKRSILKLDATCPGERLISLYWASNRHNGLFGEPIPLTDAKSPIMLDLRRFPMWRGTITHLAIGFGTHGDEVMTLRSLAVEPIDPTQAFLRTRYFGFDRAINRAGQPARLKITFEHAAGPARPATHAILNVDHRPGGSISVPAVQPNEWVTVAKTIVPPAAGELAVKLDIGSQTFTRTLHVDAQITEKIERPPDGYDVPEPRPVKTDYQIGIYYFPGWYPPRGRWHTQKGFPERDSILGWYREGKPVVADWHIKWAVENGISFFVYDWYWRDGKEELYHGLNEGFLKARYRDRMKFAIMWANHTPYADHTHEQLLDVTDYWIERYFRQSNYLMVDGKPYVSFFSPYQLLGDMGSPEKVREAFNAMRDRAKKAGLAGIHFGACAGTGTAGLGQLKQCGFDSITAYNYRATGATTLQSPYRQFLLGHEAIWKRITDANVLPYIPLLTVQWDSRPWHGPTAERRFGRATCDFAEALGRLKAFLDTTGKRMAILEAWNEWGEGSYIEPNVEFGFKDVEAIRETFAHPGDWPTNIAPDDLDIVDKYDFRFEGREPSEKTERRMTLPDPRGGKPAIGLVVRGDQLTVGDEVFHVAPNEVIEVRDDPMTLIAGKVKSFRGGNRLHIGHTDERNITPGAYVPGSLEIRDPAWPRVHLTSPQDYVVNDIWGAFEIPEKSRLKPGTKVRVSYQMSLRRIDSLYLDNDGQVQFFCGIPSPDCPKPIVPRCCLPLLANIYRPFNADRIEPHHVYTPSPDKLTPPPIINADRLATVLARLRSGQDVTIVCWGDSVTVGGDSSSTETSYVGLFESKLKERFGDANLKVINAGIGGSNTRRRFPDFQKEVLDYKPDLVTLEFVNDMGMDDAEMSERYPKILKSIRDAGAELLIVTPHFTRPDWMGLPNGRGGDPRSAVAFLKRFARENNVPLADASKRWEQLEFQGIPYETLLKNGINHPNDRGHRIFAEELMRYFPIGK